MTDQGTKAVLRLLQTTDLHGRLFPYSYAYDQPCAHVGLDSLARIIADHRIPGSLLFDCGDFFEGTPLGEIEGSENPVIQSFNALGYDGITLGNHEFNFGLDFLRNLLSGLEVPLVTTNLEFSPSLGKNVLLREVVVDPDLPPVRVAVLGVAPPALTKWNSARIGDDVVKATDMVDSIRVSLPDDADVVVVLAHTGIDPDEESDENLGSQIAAIDGVDAVMCGHIHMTFPGTDFPVTDVIDPIGGHLHGKPAVMAGSLGSHLGIIDLHLEHTALGWSVVGDSVRLIQSDRHGAGCLPARVQEQHGEILAKNRNPIGQTDCHLHSAFSVLGPDPVSSVIARAHINKAIELLGGASDAPVIAAVAPYFCGGQFGLDGYIDIPPGPISEYHLSQLYVFPNDLHLVEMTGAGVRTWLEQCAGQYGTAVPGAQRPLLNAPSYQIDSLYGLTYEIDLSQPSRFGIRGELADGGARRISNLRHNGALVQDDKRFIVASNSFRLGAAPPITAASQGRHLKTEIHFMRDVLRDYFGKGPLDTSTWPVWQFKPVAGARMVFNTMAGVQPAPNMIALRPGAHGQPRMALSLDPLAQARRSA